MKLNNVDFMLLWKTWNKNPNHIIFTKLQNNSEQSYNFAIYLIMNNKEVPERFLQTIAKDSEWSYDFARYLIRNNKEVPKIIKKSAREYRDDLRFNESFKQCYNKL